MPSEPNNGKGLGDDAALKAYPVEESGGFVWIWMGSREEMVPFEPPVWAVAPLDKIAVVKCRRSVIGRFWRVRLTQR